MRRTWTLLEAVDGEIRNLKALPLTRPEAVTSATSHATAQLLTVRAIGPVGASVLATEIFGWRRIRNGRELGALVGLVPAPYQSGETDYDQGITRGQCACPSRHRAAGLGLAPPPTGQRPDALVSTAVWHRWEAAPEDWDCRTGAQTVNRTLALSGNGGGP